MKRPDGLEFFCFECMYFGGVCRCYRFQQPLRRQGFSTSCEQFERGELFRAYEKRKEAEVV